MLAVDLKYIINNKGPNQVYHLICDGAAKWKVIEKAQILHWKEYLVMEIR